MAYASVIHNNLTLFRWSFDILSNSSPTTINIQFSI
jgi:hypothetical protein